MLATALRRRAESLGVQVRCGVPVTEVLVSGGRATGVRLADGDAVRARHAVLADVPAPALYRDLVGAATSRHGSLDDLGRFEWDDATLKVNWALDSPIPWSATGARRAGTVHLGVDDDGLVDVAADLSVGRMPQRPVHAPRPDDDRRPDAIAGGHGVGLGLHPPAAPAGRRRGRGRPSGRADRGGGGGRGAGVPRDPDGPARCRPRAASRTPTAA